MGKVRVAVIGVGNCASSLVQGAYYYRAAKPDQAIPGLVAAVLGDYAVADIEFSAAFDVDPAKVGRDLSEAIFLKPNNTYRFATVPTVDVQVSLGRTIDTIGEMAVGSSSDVARILRESGTDVVVNFLPVRSDQATKWYVEQVLGARCALVNCAPVSIAREEYWQYRFREEGVPLIGDDVKSQVNAMAVHRVLTRLFRFQGLKLDRTSQLNIGGNEDLSSLFGRTGDVGSESAGMGHQGNQLDYDFGEGNAYIGPTAQVPWLNDRRWSYIHLAGRTFGDVPFTVELKLESWESPGSGGLAIDAARCAKIAMDRGLSGILDGPSALFMTRPPHPCGDDEARGLVEAFLGGGASTGKEPS